MNRIVGHGIDLVELKEFEMLIARSGDNFAGRCFTASERDYASDGPNRISRLAARFAAKEAVMKAIGTGWIAGVSWKDIEIIHQLSGAPTVEVSGAVERIAAEKGIVEFLVSLSHTTNFATASVIAVGDRN